MGRRCARSEAEPFRRTGWRRARARTLRDRRARSAAGESEPAAGRRATTAASATSATSAGVETRRPRRSGGGRMSESSVHADAAATPSISPSGTWTRAWWPGRARARPPCWWSISGAWWRRASTRCAFWPSRSPRRPPATCARSWRRRSRRTRRARPPGAGLGVHGARLLRAAAARERRVRGHRPGIHVADERE